MTVFHGFPRKSLFFSKNHCFYSVFDEIDRSAKCECFLRRPRDYSQDSADPAARRVQDQVYLVRQRTRPLPGQNHLNTRANATVLMPRCTHYPVTSTATPVPRYPCPPRYPPPPCRAHRNRLPYMPGRVHQASYFYTLIPDDPTSPIDLVIDYPIPRSWVTDLASIGSRRSPGQVLCKGLRTFRPGREALPTQRGPPRTQRIRQRVSRRRKRWSGGCQLEPDSRISGKFTS